MPKITRFGLNLSKLCPKYCGPFFLDTVYISKTYNPRAIFLPLIVLVCLHSNFSGRLRTTPGFCNRMRISRLRSSKVDDSDTNGKRLLVIHGKNLRFILHRF